MALSDMFPGLEANGDFDQHAAQELELYTENDAHLWSRRRPEFVKNVQRKLKRGNYDHERAVKLWVSLAQEGARQYAREFGDGSVRSVGMGRAVQVAVAARMADEAILNMKDGEVKPLIPGMTAAQLKAAIKQQAPEVKRIRALGRY